MTPASSLLARALPVVECCVPITTRGISDDEATSAADLFKALADPYRVRIVNLLVNSDEALCVCELTDALGLSQPTTSFHLKKLVGAGLLSRERRGTWAYYSINEPALRRVGDVVSGRKGTTR